MDRQDHRYFRRLAALLLALAGLAERAAGACLPVRCLVLWILRPAEAAARAYAIEATGSSFPLVGYRRNDETPDASRIAGNLRALAAVFRALAHRARFARRSSGAPRGPIFPPSRLSIADCLRMLAALRSRLIDTS